MNNTNNKNKSFMTDLSLLFVGIIWGSGFVVTKMAFNYNMSPTLIMSCRFVLAAAFFYIVFRKRLKNITKSDFKYGSKLGTLLFLAFFIQTIGLKYTSPSNSAFLTSTTVIMVPFISWIVSKKMPSKKIFLAAVISITGIAILTRLFSGEVGFNLGDTLSLISTFFFSMHISYSEVCTKNVEVEKLTFMQFASAAVLGLVSLIVFDFKSVYDVTSVNAVLPILYLGIFNICIAYFLQTRALKTVIPSKVALLLSTESIFASIFSVILGYEMLTVSLVVGGTLVFAAVLITESNLTLGKKLQLKREGQN